MEEEGNINIGWIARLAIRRLLGTRTGNSLIQAIESIKRSDLEKLGDLFSLINGGRSVDVIIRKAKEL